MPDSAGTDGSPSSSPESAAQTARRLAEEEDHPNLFALLGLPERYEVDPDELRRRYRDLSRALHPDHHGGISSAEREGAERCAAQVNRAYATLRDPYRRAEYLLRLRGAPSSEEERATPPELLMTMMERNETLAEARLAGTGSPERRAALAMRAELEGEQAEGLDRVAALLNGLPEEGGPRHEALVAARRAINGVAYARKMIRDLAELALEE